MSKATVAITFEVVDVLARRLILVCALAVLGAHVLGRGTIVHIEAFGRVLQLPVGLA
jgi:hypothetical protein